MPVPSSKVSVTAEALPKATKGSAVSAYFYGIFPSAEPGQGVSELTGSMGCSASHSESYPSCSALLARMAMSTE